MHSLIDTLNCVVHIQNLRTGKMKKILVKMIVLTGLFLCVQPAFHNSKVALDGPWPTPDPNCAPHCPVRGAK
jgi:hypothetical protein